MVQSKHVGDDRVRKKSSVLVAVGERSGDVVNSFLVVMNSVPNTDLELISAVVDDDGGLAPSERGVKNQPLLATPNTIGGGVEDNGVLSDAKADMEENRAGVVP